MVVKNKGVLKGLTKLSNSNLSSQVHCSHTLRRCTSTLTTVFDMYPILNAFSFVILSSPLPPNFFLSNKFNHLIFMSFLYLCINVRIKIKFFKTTRKILIFILFSLWKKSFFFAFFFKSNCFPNFFLFGT